MRTTNHKSRTQHNRLVNTKYETLLGTHLLLTAVAILDVSARVPDISVGNAARWWTSRPRRWKSRPRWWISRATRRPKVGKQVEHYVEIRRKANLNVLAIMLTVLDGELAGSNR